MDVYNIIRQLTDHEDDRGEMRRECFNALLPIMDCLKGWDPYPAKSQFNFYPNEDYHYQEGYEVKINVDDDVERVEKIEALNKDIDEYNDWVNEKNKLHAEELLEKAQPSNTEAFDVKHLQLKNPSYKTLERYKPWLCTFKMDITGLTDIIGDIWRYIDDEEIYKLKEEMHIKLFVKRFNATLFDYIRQAVNWEEENHAFGIDSLWYEPNREFVTWFSIRNLRPLVPEVTMSRRNDHDVLPPGKNDKEYIIIEPFKTGFFSTGDRPNQPYSPLPLPYLMINRITNVHEDEKMKELFGGIQDWTVPLKEIEQEMRHIFLENRNEPSFYDENKAKETITKCYEWGCKYWTQNGKRITSKQMRNASTQYPKSLEDEV